MAAETPTTPPLALVAGDTLKFTQEFSDYPPADGWVLSFRAVSNVGNAVTVNATTSGTGFLVTVPAANTANMNAGEWAWVETVTLSGERFTVATGTLEVKTDIPATSGTSDQRSHAKTMLDLIEACLEGRVVDGIESHSIGGVPINLIPLERLVVLRDKYYSEVARQEQAEALARGLGGGRNIRVRFT
jgi:hypothetical protein